MLGYRILLPILIFVACKESAPEKTEAPPIETIATVKQVENEVSYKRKTDINWDQAQVGVKLANYDLVKTAEKSTAVIAFSGQSDLKVEQKSLVVVLKKISTPDREEQVLSLPEGELTGNIHNNSQKDLHMEVRTPKGWIRTKVEKGTAAKSVSFNLKVVKKKVTVKTIEGDLEVVTSGASKKLTAGQQSDLVGDVNSEVGDYSYDQLPADVKIVTEVEEKPEEPVVKAPVKESAPKLVVKKQKPIFKIEKPEKTNIETSEQKIVFRGQLTGDIEAYLNGETIVPVKGQFQVEQQLREGLNVFTFQVVKEKGKLSNLIYKVIKK